MVVTDSGLGTTYTAGNPYLDILMTDFYIPRVNDAKNNAAALLGYIPETSDRIAGKFVVEAVDFGRNINAMNFVGDRGQLPDPHDAQALSYAYRTRTMYCRVLIDGGIIRASDMDVVRYVDAVERIMKQKADDMAVEMNRVLHGDGSGRLAEAAGAPSGGPPADTIVLQLNQNIASPATCTSPPTQFLNTGAGGIGDRIAFLPPSGAPVAVAAPIVYVSTIDEATATITVVDRAGAAVAINAGVAAGHWVCRVSNETGNLKETAYRREPMGIAGIFNDVGVADGNGPATGQVGSDDFGTAPGSVTTFQGIPVAANVFNQAVILRGGGVLRPPTEELLQVAFDQAEERNNAQVTMLLSGYGERSRFGETLTPEKRYTNTMTLSGGWKALDMKGYPWVVDRHCLRNRIYGLGLESGGFTQHVETPLRPLDHYGPHWYRLQDDDAYQAAWVTDFNIGVGVRERSGFLLTDIERAA